MNVWWSYLLAVVSVVALYVAGRKNRWGWAILVGAQGVWITYAIATRQWGFIVSALIHVWVCGRNWLAWSRDETKEPRETP